VNFADSDFAIAETDETTPAYIYFEENVDGNFITSSITHGEIVESLKDSHRELSEQKIYWTSKDWSAWRITTELLLKEWFQGNAVASYETEKVNPYDADSFFKRLGYTFLH
jgi:hypothetical protein